MENTYKNFQNNHTSTFNVYSNPAHKAMWEEMCNPVDTYPDPRPVNPRSKQKTRRPLRICQYKDFRITETKNTHHGCWWTLEYIPTGEVVATNQILYHIALFLDWWYNQK